MSDTDSLLRSYLETVPEVTLAYLFGSQVAGSTGPLSDYDIAVWVCSPVPQLRYRLSHALGCLLETDRIDLVFLNQAPIELAYAVIAQGRLIYQRSLAERVEFEAGVLGRYGDYLPILKHQHEETLAGTPYETGVSRYRAALRRTERTLAAIRAAKQ
jgi:predicted nucleotidyltransferase